MKTYEIPFHVPDTQAEREHLGQIYLEHARYLLNGSAHADHVDDVTVVPPAEAGGKQPLRRLITEVRAPRARKALYFMAKETLEGRTPDSQRIRELVGLPHGPDTANNLGGVLTSIGFALKRVPGSTRPYSVFWGPTDRATYVMERPVAEAILDLLDDQGNLR